MVFSSTIFIFAFLPIVLIIYYIVPKQLRNIVLLLFSLLFYYWGTKEYFYVLLISISLNYLTGLIIDLVSGRMGKRLTLILGIILNLSLLFTFKYLDFFVENTNHLFRTDLPLLHIVLPIGISFFTFQGLSYIIDVYMGKSRANKNPFQIALFISLFPQLVAGPIVKYNEIRNQIQSRFVTLESFSYGIKRFILGLSKKVLISNLLGETADSIFSAVTNSGIDTPTAWLGIFCYSMQIYFDFSGYSDMAIGLGKLFGFTFLENFNYPYISKSITEFWRRWHISLSSWFRDYLYIPMGGNRKGNIHLHLFVVFLTTGLWHGASWNFVLWGLWHGLFIIMEKRLIPKDWYQKIPSVFHWFMTIVIVLFGWVLFRSPDLPSTIEYCKVLLGIQTSNALSYTFSYYIDARIGFTLVLSVLACGPFLSRFAKRLDNNIPFALCKTLAITGLFILCILYIVNGVYNPFIYFQF